MIKKGFRLMWKRARELGNQLLRRASTSELPGEDDTTASLDSPKPDLRADVLNRGRIAREIYRIINDQGNDRSVRIGLFGDWGYGKTTIANWVADLAAKDGHVVITFNPWSIRDLSELWLSFGIELHEALERHGVSIPSWTRTKARVARLRREYGTWADTLAPGKLINSVAATFIRFDRGDAKVLRESLGSRRVVVIIDDIDRADPRLLPQLLLSLRELLDVPGLAFLVPFEKSIVANALINYQSSLGSGERFLEKIFDFQVTIPETTVEGRWLLFSTNIDGIIEPKAIDQLRELRDCLPDNPRRIKRLVLYFELVKQELKRHKVEEIDWPSLFLGFLLKLESERFFRAYVAETFRESGARLATFMAQDKNERTEEARQRIKALVERSKINDPEMQKRLEALGLKWEGMPHWNNSRVLYTLRLFDLPEAFTWAEIDDLLGKWTDPFARDAIQNLIKKKKEDLGKDAGAVVRELVDSLLSSYNLNLEGAASAYTSSEQAAKIEEANQILGRVEALFFNSDIVDATNRQFGFAKLLDIYRSWAHFTGNASDANIREKEQAVLIRMIAEAGESWRDYAEKLECHRSALEKVEYEAFCTKARDAFLDKALSYVVAMLQTPDGAMQLLGVGAPQMAQRLLVDINSQLWSGAPGASPAEEALRNAQHNGEVQKNARTILAASSGEHLASIGIDLRELYALLHNERAAIAFWNAVIAQPLQFRMLRETRFARRRLILGGVSEAALVFPEWLHRGEEDDKKEDDKKRRRWALFVV